jgi:hypothetical protein
MVTILLFLGSMALLYGLIQLSEAVFQRWFPGSTLSQNPIVDNGPVIDNLAYGLTGTGMPIDVAGAGIGEGIGEAIATEMAGETAAIGEAIAPMIESSQHFLAHGAEAIGHAVGEAFSAL